ncbi:nucleotide-diphospho-sugar transferase [Chiua virens]|nr:nucleotide-diphospho-sugar transferase [Chiua virens]
MSISYAFATLLTSDDYLPGALTVAAALKDVHRHLPSDQAVQYETVCLVTPEIVDVTSIRLLRKAFNVVVGVETIVPPDSDSLTLLGRPDLNTALTKLHVFRLTQYAKVIFLDADVLPLRPLSHLFHLDHEFSAVPDVGWPDIFNSGVMVLSPGDDKFQELQVLLNTKGSWDGADQGLLNEWRGNNWNRLSFTYNTTPTAIYTYAPAYQRFGSQISAVHFIGPHKPWHSIAYRVPGSSTQSTNMDVESSIEQTSTAQPRVYDYGSLVDPSLLPHGMKKGASRAIVAGGVLGLEELRRAALEGMEASGIFTPQACGEGEYRTMPLEGRFDLMRPRTRAERKQTELSKDVTETPESEPVPTEPPSTTPEPSTPVGQTVSLPSGSPVRWTTLPTPGTNEIPPAPHARLVSLPPTPLHYVFSPYKPLRYTREATAQTVPFQSQQEGIVDSTQNAPAVETPPSVVSPATTDAYFPKVWDLDRNWSSASPASSETSLTTMEPSPSETHLTRNAFFTASFMPVTPEKPRSRGQHRNMAGEENGFPTPVTPDLTKVKRVFPWEERPRQTPGRVFPDEGSPLTTLPHLPAFATPEKKGCFQVPFPDAIPLSWLSPVTSVTPSTGQYSLTEIYRQTSVGYTLCQSFRP